MPRARPGTSARLPSPLPNLLVLTPLGDAIPRTRYPPRSRYSSLDRGTARLWLPGLAVRVPADQHVRGDERGDPLQLGRARARRRPRARRRALPGRGSAFVFVSIRRPSLLSARGRARRRRGKRCPPMRSPGRSVSAATLARRMSSASPPSATICRTASSEPALIPRDRRPRMLELPSGARPAPATGRRAAASTSTSVCCAVTISVSSGSR